MFSNDAEKVQKSHQMETVWKQGFSYFDVYSVL